MADEIRSSMNGTAEEVRPPALEAMQRPQRPLASQSENVRQLMEEPESVEYNICQIFLLKKDTDLNRLAEAMDRVFRAHPVLNSVWKLIDREPFLVHDESIFEPTRIISLSDEAFEKIQKSPLKPFEGFGKALHRRAVYHTPTGNYLFWDFHHSIIDGRCMSLMRDQVGSCYKDPDYQIPEDRAFCLLEKMLQDQNDEQSPAYREAAEYYARHNEKIRECACILKPDLPGPDGEPSRILKPYGITRREHERSALFLAATLIAVAKLNRENAALVYSVYHGRDEEAKNQSIMMYAAELPIYLNLEKTKAPKEILDDVQAQMSFGMTHTTFPYARLHPIPAYGLVLFNYQKGSFDQGNLSFLIEKVLHTPMGQGVMVNSGLLLSPEDGKMTWYCGYQKNRHSAGRIEDLYAEIVKAVQWLREGKDA